MYISEAFGEIFYSIRNSQKYFFLIEKYCNTFIWKSLSKNPSVSDTHCYEMDISFRHVVKKMIFELRNCWPNTALYLASCPTWYFYYFFLRPSSHIVHIFLLYFNWSTPHYSFRIRNLEDCKGCCNPFGECWNQQWNTLEKKRFEIIFAICIHFSSASYL